MRKARGIEFFEGQAGRRNELAANVRQVDGAGHVAHAGDNLNAVLKWSQARNQLLLDDGKGPAGGAIHIGCKGDRDRTALFGVLERNFRTVKGPGYKEVRAYRQFDARP